MKLLENIKEFANRTSLHGVSYLFDKSNSYFERFIWCILFLCSAFFSIYMVHTSFVNWQESKVITTLKTSSKPIQDLKFPAITICGKGQHSGLVEKVLYKEFIKWSRNKMEKMELRERFSLFMKEKFQIGTDTPTILDILNMNTAPSVEASESKMVLANLPACDGKNLASKNMTSQIPSE